MPEAMAAGAFGDAGREHGLVHRPLKNGFVHVISPLLACPGVFPAPFLGKHPLPGPFKGSIRVFPLEGVGHGNRAPSIRHILFVGMLYQGKVLLQGVLEGPREHGDPVLSSLTVADQYLVSGKIDVLHAKREAFGEPKAGPVHEAGRDELIALKAGEHRPHFVPAEDDGEALGLLGPDEILEAFHFFPQYLPIQIEEGGQGLILGRGAHVLLDGEPGEEGVDSRNAQLFDGEAFILGEEAGNP